MNIEMRPGGLATLYRCGVAPVYYLKNALVASLTTSYNRLNKIYNSNSKSLSSKFLTYKSFS